MTTAAILNISKTVDILIAFNQNWAQNMYKNVTMAFKIKQRKTIFDIIQIDMIYSNEQQPKNNGLLT